MSIRATRHRLTLKPEARSHKALPKKRAAPCIRGEAYWTGPDTDVRAREEKKNRREPSRGRPRYSCHRDNEEEEARK